MYLYCTYILLPQILSLQYLYRMQYASHTGTITASTSHKNKIPRTGWDAAALCGHHDQIVRRS